VTRRDHAGFSSFLHEHRLGPADREAARAKEHACAAALGRIDERAPTEVVATEGSVVTNAEARLLEDLPAERGPLVGERNVEAARGCLEGGGEPCRPAADDEEVVRLAR